MTADETDEIPELIESRDLAPLFEHDADTPLWMQTVADLCDDIALVLDEITQPAARDDEPVDDEPGDEGTDEGDTTEEGQ